MGYDLHITRKEYWFDEDKDKEISLEEWQQIVAEDNDLIVDEINTADYDIVYVGHDLRGVKGNHACFWYNEGNIEAKNPDEVVITKMVKIATLLNAKVQGDDGELY